MSKRGFPPTFEEDNVTIEEDYNAEDSMVRVGSIAFSGNVRLLLNSKPIQKPISNTTFALAKLKAFESIIQEESSKNLNATGRRGCTTTAVYDLIEKRVKSVIQEKVKDIAVDLALDNGRGTKDTLQAIKTNAKQTLKDYIMNAGEWSEQRLQSKIADELDKIEKDGKPQSKRKQFLSSAKRFGLAQLTDIINMGEDVVEEDEL